MGHILFLHKKKQSEYKRLFGKTTAVIEDKVGISVKINLEQQRLYQGKWEVEEQALLLEQQAYLSQKVNNPISLLAEVGTKKSTYNTNWFNDLHKTMRVGDRVTISSGDKSWIFWKRGIEVGDEFRSMTQAFILGESSPLPWKHESLPQRKLGKVKRDLFGKLVFSLHESRDVTYMLNFAYPLESHVIQRNKADGEITIVAKATKPITINSQPVEPTQGLYFVQIAPANSPVNLVSDGQITHVLVVSNVPSLIKLPDFKKEIMLHEKELKELKDITVYGLTSYTMFVDLKQLHTQVGDTADPMGIERNLNSIEIGPHDRSGQYERIWILNYEITQNRTQRQLGTKYQVNGVIKEGRTDNFVRRNNIE